MNDRPKKVIVGLDIGTTKVCTIVATCTSLSDQSDLEIIGIGHHPGHGLKKGQVVSMEKTTKSIAASLEEAKLMSGVEISKVHISIAGGHIYSFNSHGAVATKNFEISKYDINRAIEAAKAVVIPTDREILHTIPQEYKIDSMGGIKEPIGMRGNRLEVQVHMVTAATALLQNLVKCVEMAGVDVESITLQPLCSSEAVLSIEEKDLGVVLVDIGGGTTDLAIWQGGSLLHTHIIPIGGNHFTNDLAVALKTTHSEAERIKIEYGSVIPDKINPSIHITVQGLPGTRARESLLSFVAEVLAARAEELLNGIKRVLEEKNLQDKIIGGYVFTGGGSLIKLLPEMAEFILEKPTKIGFPIPIGGMTGLMQSPKYATAMGLLIHSQKSSYQKEYFGHLDSKKSDLIRKFGETLKNVFREIF